MLKKSPEAFVFMKVGNHSGESFEEILERKNREFRQTGRIFWGYGGNVCHPLAQVQPFVRLHIKELGSVYLLMEYVDSRAKPDLLPAKEYSDDGILWRPVPDGIRVTGSRYAFVLDEIRPGDLDLLPEDYVVGIGPSRGRLGSEFLRGRTDKACLTRMRSSDRLLGGSKSKHITFAAKLLEPYAVVLR